MTTKRIRVWILIALVLCVIVGLSTKAYRGPGESWIRGSSGGIFYVLFFSLLVRLAFIKSRSIVVVIAVLFATCAIEFLQLYQPEWLQQIRANRIGRLFLGNSFSWADFPPYFIGALLAWGVLGFLMIRTDVVTSKLGREKRT